MKRTGAYIVICVSLILVGVILAKLLPLEQKKVSSILPEQAASFELLLPTIPLPGIVDMPVEMPAEVAVSVASEAPLAPAISLPLELPVELSELFTEPAEELPVSEPVLIQPSVVLQSLVALREEAAVVEELPSIEPVQATLCTPVPAVPKYIYFYTGIPVQPAPMPAMVHTGGVLHTGGFMSVTFVPAPVIQSPVIPVFTPRVVPSRVGAPRLIYSNGVVIRPTVYFPNQPFRNVLRAVTP